MDHTSFVMLPFEAFFRLAFLIFRRLCPTLPLQVNTSTMSSCTRDYGNRQEGYRLQVAMSFWHDRTCPDQLPVHGIVQAAFFVDRHDHR